ncbi:MAG: phosphate signaling complex PhoU family protein [Ktedonobacteraceae bacterium]
MARTILDIELQALDAQIIELGRLVDDALGTVLEALEAGDQAKSGMVIEADALIDGLRRTVEEHTIRLLTLQQLLDGRDLRYLTSAFSIVSDLERIGDGAAGIAQNILRMEPLRSTQLSQVEIRVEANAATSQEHHVTEFAIMRNMLELGYEARHVLQGTMMAFAHRDVQAARHIWQEDDVVDVRYHLVRHDLMALMEGARAIPALQNDSRILQRATYLLWIAHKLERVADHSSNVCERVVFIAEGEVGMEPYEE